MSNLRDFLIECGAGDKNYQTEPIYRAARVAAAQRNDEYHRNTKWYRAWPTCYFLRKMRWSAPLMLLGALIFYLLQGQLEGTGYWCLVASSGLLASPFLYHYFACWQMAIAGVGPFYTGSLTFSEANQQELEHYLYVLPANMSISLKTFLQGCPGAQVEIVGILRDQQLVAPASVKLQLGKEALCPWVDPTLHQQVEYGLVRA